MVVAARAKNKPARRRVYACSCALEIIQFEARFIDRLCRRGIVLCMGVFARPAAVVRARGRHLNNLASCHFAEKASNID